MDQALEETDEALDQAGGENADLKKTLLQTRSEIESREQSGAAASGSCPRRKSGAPKRIRTSDLWLRRPTLYPTELRALSINVRVRHPWRYS